MATGILSLGADISLALGQFGDKIDGLTEAIHQWLKENPRQDPFAIPIVNAVNTGGAAPTFQVIPLVGAATQTGPPGGYRWGLGRIAVYGAITNGIPDPSTVIASSVAMLFKAGTTPASGAVCPNIGLVASSQSDQVATIPWTKSFPMHAVTVGMSEDLFVVTKGHGNNANIIVEAEVLVFKETRYMQP